jgi:hypothetical protein
VDTTVQPKAITFPTDAKLLHAAIKGLNRLANKCGVRLRQSYLRIAKRAAMMASRYAHAKQFNRRRKGCTFAFFASLWRRPPFGLGHGARLRVADRDCRPVGMLSARCAPGSS